MKEVKGPEKVLDYAKISEKNLILLEQKLSILNPHMLEYVMRLMNEIVEPVYKEEK